MSEIVSYYEKRLKAIGLTEETNKRVVYGEGRGQSVPIIYYSEKLDAITIPYTDPEGEISMIEQGSKLIPFERLRYRVPKSFKGKDGKEKAQRYNQPKGSGVYTYMTPGIVERCRKGQQIKTLYVIEGEFKAISADIAFDLPFIGIGGIQNIKDKEHNEIDQYISKVITTLKPESVMLLFDADCLNVVYKEGVDLSIRLRNFYDSIVNFREMLKPFSVDVYFGHILSKYADFTKGLDDLLEGAEPKKRTQIKKELENLSTGEKEFLHVMMLSPGSERKLERHFNLSGVTEFYEAYRDQILEKEFIFKNEKWYFDGEKVQKAYLHFAKQYIRVGCDFYKKMWKINQHIDIKHQQPVMVLAPWSVGEITRDFGENKKFLSMIPKYDMFVNVPCNTGGYKRIFEYQNEGLITRCYNRYNEVRLDIKPGPWPTIEKFLQHIFSAENTSGECLYQFGLDYLQLAFYKPTQKLPVICLVSKKRNTGKTTFLLLLKRIFQENASILDNERFTGKFTSHFVDKLIVALDEGFIPIEQKLMKERIKNYSTGQTQWLEGKGKDANEIDNFMHLILCSNDESNFMQIDEGENRFAVIKVDSLSYDDPRILQKMEEEIGSFIHYLGTRKLYYEENKSRFSFDTKIYETEALTKVQERTMNRRYREVVEYITEMFQNTGKEELFFAPVDIVNGLQEEGGSRLTKVEVKTFITEELLLKPEKQMRYPIYRMEFGNEGSLRVQTCNVFCTKTGKPYKFQRSNFIKPEDEDPVEETPSFTDTSEGFVEPPIQQEIGFHY